MNLLDAWKNTPLDQPPYVLDADVPVLKSSKRRKDLEIIGTNCHEVEAHPDYDREKSIHFSLIPQPFNGDLLNAEVYVMTLNPGFDCSDYDANYRKRCYRQALLDNLKQDQPPDVLPFVFLDPKFHWHGGYRYWFSKLKAVIRKVSDNRGITFDEARCELGRKLAVIELFPYQSLKSAGLGLLPDNLHSSNLAREFVEDYVVERVRRGNAIAIVVRQVRRWNKALPNDIGEDDGLIRYRRGEAMGAHITPRTRGGKAIIDWFSPPTTENL